MQAEIKKLKAERDSMLAKMQSAQARIKIQEQLDGLSVDDEVKALDNVRDHIKTTIAEANLGRELSESSLDSRLAALKNQAGDVQARQQLAEMKAKRAAQQAAQSQKTHVGRGQERPRLMRLTPFAKLFITVVILAVVGYAFYHYSGADIRKWAVGDKPAGKAAAQARPSSDFDALKNAPADPARNAGVDGRHRHAARRASGKLDRPLVVAINTWAGHAPGIVFNGGLDAERGVATASVSAWTSSSC